MKPFVLILSFLTLSALLSILSLAQLVQSNPAPSTGIQASVETESNDSAELLALPCPEAEEPTQLEASYEKPEAYDIAMLSYVCDSTHNFGTFCKDNVPTLDRYKYCEDLSCGSTVLTKSAGMQTRVYSHTEKDCPCGVCIYALTGLTVAESNIAYARARDGVKCKDNLVPALPPSCAGVGGINLQNVINTGAGNPRVCVFAATSASGSCSTSGSVACPPDGIKNAPPCSPTGTTPPTPSPQCLNDLINQEIANGNCWAV